MSREFSRNSWIWQISPQRLQTPGGYRLRQRICHSDGSPSLPPHSSSFSFCVLFSLTLWNCQSSQWPGQALSFLNSRALKRCQPSSMDERFEKGTMNWRGNPSYLGKKTRGRWENVEESMEKRDRMTPPSFIFAVLWVCGTFFWSWEKWQKETEKKGEPIESWEKSGKKEGGMEGEQLESLSSAPSRWIGLMNASECLGVTTSSIKAGNTAQI